MKQPSVPHVLLFKNVSIKLLILIILNILIAFILFFISPHIGVVITTGSVSYLHVFLTLIILDIPFLIYIIIFTPVILPFIIYILISTSFACVFLSPFIHTLCGFPYQSSDLSNLFCPQFNPQIFSLIIMGIFIILHILCLFRFTIFSNPKVRSNLFLYSISWPATFTFTLCGYSIFFMPIISWIPGIYSQIYCFIPFLLTCIAFYQNVVKDSTWVEIDVSMKNENQNDKNDDISTDKDKNFYRIPYTRYSLRPLKEHNINDKKRCLRIVHFTDLHLGCFLTSGTMRKFCQKAVDLDPDLILLTGDYFTYESEHMPGYLAESLEPLKSLTGRTFACLGNHDKTSGFMPTQSDIIAPIQLETIKSFEKVGVSLLIDETTTIETRIGPVQITGFDFHWIHRPKEEIYSNFFQNQKNFPPSDKNIPRIVLLHDPQDFKFFPDERILTFSGHTHGGTLGLLSLGYDWVIPPKIAMPFPHGLWGAGSNKLYVNCGFVCRFMFGNLLARLGVPNEAAFLNVYYD